MAMIRGLSFLLLMTLLVGWGNANSQGFPAKPVRLIVPTAPGTAVQDILGRLMAPEMSKIFGHPVIVENRAGAGGMLAYEFVAKQAPADGHTLVLVTVPTLAALPVTVKDLRFNPGQDLPPVTELVEARLAMASASKLPWKSFGEMVAYAKENPGKMNFGSGGLSTRLLGEVFLRDMALEMLQVSYSSGGPYFLALAAGDDIQLGFLAASSTGSIGNRLRVLSITGERRFGPLPNVPTFSELGLQIPGQSFSMNVRGATPVGVINALYNVSLQVLQLPNVKSTIEEKWQMDIVARKPEDAAKSLADQARLYAEIAKRAGIRPE